MTDQAQSVLANAVERLALSGRGFDRAVKVARTIADLAGAERVEADHVAEALSYRTLTVPEEAAQVGSGKTEPDAASFRFTE